MSNSTITLQTVVNFCSTHADLLPLSGVGGYTNEPALSLCNDALSDLITDPNDWIFNRVEMPVFFTAPNKQDCLFAGASAFTIGGTSQGWAIDLASANAITVAGGVVTVKTLEAHRFAISDTVYMTGVAMSPGTSANYNSVFTDNGSSSAWSVGWVITGVGAKSFTFAAVAGQANADVGGASGITDFGFASSASMVDPNNVSSPQNVFPLLTKRELVVSSRVAIPEKVAMMHDFGTGVLKFRFLAVPGSTTFGINIVYQAKAPLKTALSQFWDPFPDEQGAVIRQALLYRMYRYLNSPTANAEYEKLQAAIHKAQAGDDAAPTDVQIQPESSLMDSSTDGIGGWW